MKILNTAILLVITLLAVPLFTWFFGIAPGPLEKEVLNRLILVTVVVIAVCFILGEITGNNSQVDKLWSIMPIIYTWMVTSAGGFSTRLVIMSVLVTIWGIRLTTNFAMKGAYSLKFWEGEEDYRWQVLRQKPEFRGKFKWSLFNLFFISGYQNILILLFTLPSLLALQFNTIPVGPVDIIAAALMLFFIVFETIADIQQWNFQSVKWAKIRKGEQPDGIYEKGFLDKGLWAYSRHPNYFAEQAIWVCFYLFSVAASGQWFNWSIAGSLLLIVLFQGSSSFSEEISASKYPLYKEYQSRIPRFIPFLKRTRKTVSSNA